jgi:membrane carboxypeptidase/penicillin-binding protein
VWFTAPLLALVLLLVLPAVGLVYHIYFDRRGLPDLEPFIRFELSTIGQVHDARGTVLVELAREYRRVVSYDEVPAVLRHATALGASEVRLLELAGAYRAMASGGLAEPHIIDRVTGASGAVLYEASRSATEIGSTDLSLIQEGLRGVVRLPVGTAHALGKGETGGRTALPIFREIMLRVYERRLVGPVPSFPREIEDGIDRYLLRSVAR